MITMRVVLIPAGAPSSPPSPPSDACGVDGVGGGSGGCPGGGGLGGGDGTDSTTGAKSTLFTLTLLRTVDDVFRSMASAAAGEPMCCERSVAAVDAADALSACMTKRSSTLPGRISICTAAMGTFAAVATLERSARLMAGSSNVSTDPVKVRAEVMV